MPELPEVETVRRGLVPVMEGQVIARADIRRPDLRWPFPPRMAERLTGQQVLRLRRRSKYILCDLGSGETLLIHLGMSGRMTINPEPLPPENPLWDCPNLLISPHTSDQVADWELRFADHFAENLARWRAGHPLTNIISP